MVENYNELVIDKMLPILFKYIKDFCTSDSDIYTDINVRLQNNIDFQLNAMDNIKCITLNNLSPIYIDNPELYLLRNGMMEQYKITVIVELTKAMMTVKNGQRKKQ